MHAVSPRDRPSVPQHNVPDPRPRVGLATTGNDRISRNSQNPGSKAVGEGLRKLKSRLVSSDIPEEVVDELLEQSMMVNYKRGSFVFTQGAPTDLVFWISSGLIDIIFPGADGEQVTSSVLGAGDIFGFVGVVDEKGR